MTAFFRRSLDDDALDAMLEAADAELLAHARAVTDPFDTIRILHAGLGQRRRTDSPSPPSVVTREAFERRRRAVKLRYLAKASEGLVAGVFNEVSLDRLAPVLASCGSNLGRLRTRYVNEHVPTDKRWMNECQWAVQFIILQRQRLNETNLASVLTSLGACEERLRRVAQGAMAAAIAHERGLFEMTMDVSGEDLSHMTFEGPWLLENVVWTDATRWSPRAYDMVVMRSRRIAAGVYQVLGESPHDRDHLCV
ncbi:hypothetical protein [Embleya hyalina]|uniref:Uncharacterized protein n=1 Tax=Embleya hyalina TaxID=516124 RepID=A0A401Z419_9ACTN|nr:hypothetical protein [Embleya hyalina]GCE01594.1 hypothetical protein EHYA_09360 [Embleya hyalina]